MNSIKNFYWITTLIVFALPQLGFANVTEQVQLKSGIMGLHPFLEMVSNKLDLQIDASGLGESKALISVPDVGSVSLDRAKALVLTSLYAQGYSWIYYSSTQLYRIVKLRDARDLEIPLLSDSDPIPDSDLLVTYFMTLKYSPPEYVARSLRSFMPANSRVIADIASNSVLITDSAHNISKLKELVQRLDTPQASQQAKEILNQFSKKNNISCSPSSANANQLPGQSVVIALFSLIALVFGFLARGYVIRRIEGGL